MSEYIRDIYINILKHGWKVFSYKDLGNGCTVIVMKSPRRNEVISYQSYVLMPREQNDD